MRNAIISPYTPQKIQFNSSNKIIYLSKDRYTLKIHGNYLYKLTMSNWKLIINQYNKRQELK